MTESLKLSLLSNTGSIRCYLFILCSEVRPIQLVDGHHNSHHVFTIHDGDGEDIFGLILCQLVHKVTVMRALRREEMRKEKTLMNTPFLSVNAASKGFPLSTNSRPFLLHSTYWSSCVAGVINCVPPGVKQWKSSSLTAKKEQKPADSDHSGLKIGDTVLIWVREGVCFCDGLISWLKTKKS